MSGTAPDCDVSPRGPLPRERNGPRSRTPARAHRLRADFRPRRESASEVRRVLRTFLDGRGVDRAVIAQVVLAADEAFANAVTHGHGKRAISVSARVSRRQVSVEIRDHGRGFAPRRSRSRPVPAASRVHGRGVFLIEGLMDEVEIRPGRHGTTVRMVRWLA